MKRDTLEQMTVKELRVLGAKKGLANVSRLIKADLIDALATTATTPAVKDAVKLKATAANTVSKKSPVKKQVAPAPAQKITAKKAKKVQEPSAKTVTEKNAKASPTKITAAKTSTPKVTKATATKAVTKPAKSPIKSRKTVATRASTRTRKRLSSTAPTRKTAPVPAGLPAEKSSSSLRVATPQAFSSPPAPQVSGANPGLPIPEHYGRDRLVLMVQDPHHVFAYWELQGDTVARVTSEAHGGDPVLIIYVNGVSETRDIDLRGGNYYLSVIPNQDYEAELAIRSSSGAFHVLARSNKVHTPSPAISSRSDEQWMGVDESFHELLELAGLPDYIAGAGSVGRLRDQRQNAWGWQNSNVPGISSAVLSSHNLSSRSRLAKTP